MPANTPGEPPVNVLLITSDQQHYDTLGATNPRIRTPALDRLAGEGTRFDRAYCSNPVCSPSRASIITGLYPAWHHCWTIGVKLPEDVPTVGDRFQEAGGSALHGFHSHLRTDRELRESIACYYGMISLMDRAIGRILESLDRLGIAGNTLVLFSTDHGHFLGQHGLIAKGAFHYEDLLRIPMLVRWPGRVPAGRVSAALQSQVDFAPTFLAACGLPVPGLMQGVNQMDVWSGRRETARDHAVIENRHNPTTVHLRTMVTDRYKITVYRSAEYGELFDLRDDPEERRNRWDDPAFADIRSRLLHRFVRAELEREPTRMPRICGA